MRPSRNGTHRGGATEADVPRDQSRPTPVHPSGSLLDGAPGAFLRRRGVDRGSRASASASAARRGRRRVASLVRETIGRARSLRGSDARPRVRALARGRGAPPGGFEVRGQGRLRHRGPRREFRQPRVAGDARSRHHRRSRGDAVRGRRRGRRRRRRRGRARVRRHRAFLERAPRRAREEDPRGTLRRGRGGRGEPRRGRRFRARHRRVGRRPRARGARRVLRLPPDAGRGERVRGHAPRPEHGHRGLVRARSRDAREGGRGAHGQGAADPDQLRAPDVASRRRGRARRRRYKRRLRGGRGVRRARGAVREGHASDRGGRHLADQPRRASAQNLPVAQGGGARVVPRDGGTIRRARRAPRVPPPPRRRRGVEGNRTVVPRVRRGDQRRDHAARARAPGGVRGDRAGEPGDDPAREGGGQGRRRAAAGRHGRGAGVPHHPGRDALRGEEGEG